MKATQGQLEAKISESIIKFERDYMGRGPEETRTHIINDVIFVRLKGVLTVAEKKLAKDVEGIKLIKRTRLMLLENARELLKEIIRDLTGVKVVSLHTDISTSTGERIIVFSLDENLQEKIKQ